jgi:hypothetical protein
MARKKAGSENNGRSNPRNNKSLAIRNVLKKMPSARASEITAAVKKEYGQDVSKNMVYMVKTKTNMAADRKGRKSSAMRNRSPMTTAALWVEAIKTARHLLKATGSVANATAVLKALDS